MRFRVLGFPKSRGIVVWGHGGPHILGSYYTSYFMGVPEIRGQRFMLGSRICDNLQKS